MQTLDLSQAAELATVTRSGLVESRHAGTALVLSPSGELVASLGDPTAPIYPRSALKPVQTIAAMQAGAELQGAQIALAAGSHTGSLDHMKVAQSILDEVSLSADSLACPPVWPADEQTYRTLILSGRSQQRLAHSCSGKHAAMLWGCDKSGWDIEDYLSTDHPLHKRTAETLGELAGEEPLMTGIDGCGAPAPAISALGLARVYSSLGAGIENVRADARLATVATAMVDYPEYVQGVGRPVTLLSTLLGGVVKNGAEGVLAIGLRSGASAVVKVLDGSSRSTALVALSLLEACGYIAPEIAARGIELAIRPVSGADRPVGSIELGADVSALTSSLTGADS